MSVFKQIHFKRAVECKKKNSYLLVTTLVVILNYNPKMFISMGFVRNEIKLLLGYKFRSLHTYLFVTLNPELGVEGFTRGIPIDCYPHVVMNKPEFLS